MAGATGNLWSVDGGNFRVAEKLLEASDAQLVRDRVIKVSPGSDGKLLVKRQGAAVESDIGDLTRVRYCILTILTQYIFPLLFFKQNIDGSFTGL